MASGGNIGTLMQLIGFEDLLIPVGTCLLVEELGMSSSPGSLTC